MGSVGVSLRGKGLDQLATVWEITCNGKSYQMHQGRLMKGLKERKVQAISTIPTLNLEFFNMDNIQLQSNGSHQHGIGMFGENKIIR